MEKLQLFWLKSPFHFLSDDTTGFQFFVIFWLSTSSAWWRHQEPSVAARCLDISSTIILSSYRFADHHFLTSLFCLVRLNNDRAHFAIEMRDKNFFVVPVTLTYQAYLYSKMKQGMLRILVEGKRSIKWQVDKKDGWRNG